ncbi:hypothetical protein EXVG_00386 [Emiliania huxleyi virus 202]|nr:hypothetical protein EXVG_00386 [Emiliania huxleyi virus 202]AHA54345.1 hypothetical protein EhV18_00299 [Emiliania huxleyi virus 18]
MYMYTFPIVVNVACVALLSSTTGKLAVVPRLNAYEGKLSFPGGKVEPNETLRRTACRELLEELNVVVSEKNLQAETFTVREHQGKKYIFTLFSAKTWTGAPVAVEHKYVKWINFDKSGLHHFAPADAKLLSQIVNKYKPNYYI